MLENALTIYQNLCLSQLTLQYMKDIDSEIILTENLLKETKDEALRKTQL